jgi:hypothetical protein
MKIERWNMKVKEEIEKLALGHCKKTFQRKIEIGSKI